MHFNFNSFSCCYSYALPICIWYRQSAGMVVTATITSMWCLHARLHTLHFMLRINIVMRDMSINNAQRRAKRKENEKYSFRFWFKLFEQECCLALVCFTVWHRGAAKQMSYALSFLLVLFFLFEIDLLSVGYVKLTPYSFSGSTSTEYYLCWITLMKLSINLGIISVVVLIIGHRDSAVMVAHRFHVLMLLLLLWPEFTCQLSSVYILLWRRQR